MMKVKHKIEKKLYVPWIRILFSVTLSLGVILLPILCREIDNVSNTFWTGYSTLFWTIVGLIIMNGVIWNEYEPEYYEEVVHEW
jgi:hypothetical protein